MPPIAPSSNDRDLSPSRQPQDTAALPKLIPSPLVAPIPNAPGVTPQPAGTEAGPSITNSASPLLGSSPSLQEHQEPSADSNNVATSRLFDTIPQVSEARNKLQQRWKPPQGLTQNLQYNLLLSGDGSIERIVPLTEAAKTYIDRTGMPGPGEPFVSPLGGGHASTIRAVLNSDGKVETFLEPLTQSRPGSP
ncbi:MAG: hypothetical protein NVSMB70_13760 [Chamaesiphon sp.]